MRKGSKAIPRVRKPQGYFHGLSSLDSGAIEKILQETMNEIYIFSAKTLRFLYVSKAALENLGYSEAEMSRLTPLSVKKRFSRKSFLQLISPLQNQAQEHLYFETFHRRKDGSEYPVEVNLWLTAFGDQPAFLAVLRDVGEKLQSEKVINLLYKAIESGVEGIAITDMIHKENPIVYVNEEFTSLFGYGRGSIYGKTMHSFFASSSANMFIGAIRSSIQRKEKFHQEVLCRKKNGENFWNDLTGAPIMDEMGKVNYFVYFNRDITFQKLAVEELERSYFNLQLLDRLGNAALANASYDELTKIIVEIFTAFISPLWCRFYTYNRENHQARIVQQSVNEKVRAFVQKQMKTRKMYATPVVSEKSVFGKAIRIKVPVYAESPGEVVKFLGSTIPEKQPLNQFIKSIDEFSVCCSAVIPLIAGGNVIGFITFGSDKGLKSKDKESIERFCSYIASVLSRYIAQEEVKKNEEKFREIFETMHDVFYRADNNGAITMISPSVYDLSGFRPEELMGRKASEFYQNPSDRARLMEEMKKNGHVENFETILVTRKGLRTVSSNIKTMQGKDGKPDGVQGVIRDITEKLKSQKAVKDRDERFRSLTENAPSTIILINKRFCIQYINKIPEGYRPEEVLGMRMIEMIKLEDRERVETIFTDVFEKGVTASYEVQRLNRDGSASWHSTTIGPVKKEGKITSAVLISENIDTKKKAEFFAKIQNGLMEKIAVNAGVLDVISQVSAECKLYFKADFCTILLLDESTGQPRFTDKEYLPPELVRRISDTCADNLNGKRECRLLHNNPERISSTHVPGNNCCELFRDGFDKNLIQSTVSSPLVTSYGKHVGNFILIYHRNYTVTKKEIEDIRALISLVTVSLEQEKYERELQRLYNNLEQRVQERTTELQSEIERRTSVELQLQEAKKQADSANKAKTRFLANMSHEIRTPLNAIIGFGDILLKKAGNLNVPVDFTDYLNHIKSSGQNLAYIINEILDLSKIEAGKMTVNPIEFDLEQLMKTVYHMNKSIALQRKNLFNYFIEPGTPLFLRSDRTKIYQVLTNLISNAIKFTPESKEILVKAEQREKGMLLLTVSDQGIGMTPEELKNIFRPFYQTDDSRTKQFEGTGLGLTITRRIVELMGGSIQVNSKPGEGSEFIVELPVEELESRSRFANTGIPGNYKVPEGSRILVVEDNILNQVMMREMFREFGSEITLCGSGMETLEKIGSIRPQLIFMDVHMPGIDGMEVVKSIRSMKAFSSIPVIGLSADVFAGTIATGLTEGMNDYLTKPVDVNKLVSVLKKHLPGNQAANESEPTRYSPLDQEDKDFIGREWDDLLQIPLYNTEKIIRKVNAVITYCRPRNISIKPLEEIKDAVYQGDEHKVKELIRQFLDGQNPGS